MGWVRGVFLGVLAASCVESSTVTCDDGRTCGAGLSCDPIHHLCVSSKARDACNGKIDDEECSYGTTVGACDMGVCIEVFCGDGVRLGLEECDGDDLGDVASCTDLGYYDDGPVACTRGCTYDVKGCSRKCGDGVKDDEERCDTTVDAAHDDCTENGYYRSGVVTCSPSCVPDLAGCQSSGFCGDGVVDPEEDCEVGVALPASTCFDNGFDGGGMGCTPFCTPDFSGCKYLGWRRVAPVQQINYEDIIVTGANTYLLASDQGYFTGVGKTVTRQMNPSGAQNSVWQSATDVWLGSYDGSIWKVTGTAATQTLVGAGNTEAIQSIFGLSSTDLYAAGRGRVLHTANGTSWSSLLTSSTNFFGVWATSSTNIYAVGASGTGPEIQHYTATGWASEPAAPLVTSQMQLNGIDGNGTTPIAVGFPGFITRRSGGGTWFMEEYDPDAFTTSINAVWVRAANENFIVGDAGLVGYYDGTWWNLSSGVAADLRSVHGVGTDVYAVGGNGVFKDTHASWASPPIYGPQGPVVAAWTTAADKTYVLTRGAIMVKQSAQFYAIGSQSFAQQPGAVAMWQSGNQFAVAATEQPSGIVGRVYRFNGSVWANDVVGAFPLTAVTGDGNVLYTAADTSALYRFNGSWAIDDAALSGHAVNALWTVGAGDIIAVGSDPGGGGIGEIRRRTTGTWVVQTLPANTNKLRAVWSSGANDIYTVGDVGTVVHWNGTAWSRVDVGTNFDLLGVGGTSSSDVWIVGKGGTVLHFDGSVWSPVRVPAAFAETTLSSVSVRAGLVLITAPSMPVDSLVLALVRTGAW